MKMPQLLVLLFTILVHAASGFPSGGRAVPGREIYAAWDDVNVVAHGLLQLGQALKENVDKTKVQMREVNAKLRDFGSRVDELEKKQQQQEEEEALQTRGAGAEERERMVAGLADQVRENVEEVKKQNKDINSRMDRLEEKVDEVLTMPNLDSNYSDHSGAPFIQKLLAAQNRRIDQLVEKIKQQQEKLEKQSLHLQALQSKVKQKRVKSQRHREGTALQGEKELIKEILDLPKDCNDVFVRGQRASGVYTIQPSNSPPFKVLCEITSEGGWTIIQKRHDGSQKFNQQWDSYKKGFGSVDGEFWLGLENIHSLSKQGQYILQVELSDQAGERQTVRYQFRLDGEEKKFTVHLEQETSPGHQGEHVMSTGLPFSTADQDNDLAAGVNCAELLSGGWWFSSCGESNLNGRFPGESNVDQSQTMFWTSTRGQSSSLRTTLMKITPVTIKQ
ncbi:angiopoietin-related protein 4-like [Solea solea]|uniref:angiopoietin-related protein 4-like n=1 Tax=Solea solea TaxID=90069 RepID=UPI00272A4DE1|nr:angiopoietin-related protein 4-like [Solea solea]